MFCFCISSALIPERKYSYTILCTPLTFTELAIFSDPFFINVSAKLYSVPKKDD